MKIDGRRGKFQYVRLPQPVYDNLKEVAVRHRLSVPKVIMLLIAQALDIQPTK